MINRTPPPPTLHSGSGSPAHTRTGRSVAELVREAVRQVWLRPQSQGPVALWDGESRRSSVEHDTITTSPDSGKRPDSMPE